ncbi:DegT/DnrJ/EryC1/StrS family aminotransferase [Pseudolysinimonas sp.]|uniref:DegT/DnrJ/EryC1/StrS family aminotransferase n=1 Tax=Pseudolysinimonas sp. TaxID=2680009 RepID=UPI003F817A58
MPESTPRPTIQLFVPKFRIDETLDAIRECLERGWTGLGYKTVEIEREWSAYTGLPHSHFLNSNTSGLHLALEVMRRRHGWEEGDEVITTPLTFVSSNHAILYSGLTPVFADIDDMLCLDPDSVLERITDRTRAVMFVGIGGNVGQYDRIRDICRERGIKLILDAAHMAGTKVEGRHVGHDADVAVFSFQAVKNLPTADSGMICYADSEDDAMARRLSWLGISSDTYARTMGGGSYKWRYEVDELGYKYNGNSIMAATALVALKYLDEDNARRREIAGLYDSALEGSGIERVRMAAGAEPSRHLYQVLIDDRDESILRLNERGVAPGVHYRDNSAYSLYAPYRSQTPRAAAASDRLLSLPLHMSLSDDDVSYVAEQLLAVSG